MSSLVIMRGGRKGVADEIKRDFASQVGVKFIKLKHNELCNTRRETGGFQALRLSVVRRGQRQEVVQRWTTNFDGKAVAFGQLIFEPDRTIANNGFAYLPDCEYNRRKLACCILGKNALWSIVDPQIEKEINQLAKEISESAEYKSAIEELARAREANILQNEEEERKRKPDNDLTGQIENALLRKELEELKAMVGGAPAAPAAPAVPAPPAIPQLVVVSDKDNAKARDQAKKDIYREHVQIVDELKAEARESKGSEAAWANMPGYREKLLPLINERAKEILTNAHSAGVHNNNS